MKMQKRAGVRDVNRTKKRKRKTRKEEEIIIIH